MHKDMESVIVFNPVGPVHQIGSAYKEMKPTMQQKLVSNVGPMAARHLMHPAPLLTTW